MNLLLCHKVIFVFLIWFKSSEIWVWNFLLRVYCHIWRAALLLSKNGEFFLIFVCFPEKSFIFSSHYPTMMREISNLSVYCWTFHILFNTITMESLITLFQKPVKMFQKYTKRCSSYFVPFFGILIWTLLYWFYYQIGLRRPGLCWKVHLG